MARTCTIHDGDSIIAFDGRNVARIDPTLAASFKDTFFAYITGGVEDKRTEAEDKRWSDARTTIKEKALDRAKLHMITLEELEEILVEVMD